MKNILYCCLFLLTFTSCFEVDNYDAPEETLKGTVIDKNTNKGLQVDVTNDNGIRIKMMEYSWSDNPTPYYFYAKQDGTFNNTKIFKGNYNVVPQGPFVPLVQKDGNNTIVDESKTLDIQGTVELNWTVEPFLNVEWVGEPVLNNDNTISVQVKVTRGTTNPGYQQKVTDIWLMINSSSPYVGEGNFDDRYTMKLEGNAANDAVGKVITMTTKGSFSTQRDYYIRVGARIDFNVEGARRFNFNEVKSVKVLSK